MISELKTFGVHRLHALMVLMLFLVAVSVGACTSTVASSPPTPTPIVQRTIPRITIIASDFTFNLPSTIPAGLVDVTLINQGAEPHQAGFVLLNTGVTFDQFHTSLIQKGLLVMRTLARIMGGANTVPPGKNQEVVLQLPAGQYVVLDATPAKDGVRDYLKGQIGTIAVTGSSNVGQVQAPTASGEVILKDFSFVLSGTISSGPITLKVTNQGLQPHEMDVYKLAPGKTEKDVLLFLKNHVGSPPFQYIGGMTAIGPGLSGWVMLNLVSGNYILISNVFDAATGKPQFALGMITPFTVQ